MHMVARVGKVRVYYEKIGQGPALVLLHGLSGSARWWRKNIPALSEHYSLYLVDLVGFGRSRGQRFSLEEAASILLDWLDQLGLERFNLAGHSMGGYIAADMAARAPDRINRLVLVDAAATLRQLGYLRGALGLVGSLRIMPLDFLPVLFTDALRAGPFTLHAAISAVLSADLGERLSAVQVRTLIVWGEQDRLLPFRLGEELHLRLPRSQFLLIPDAGHNPMWDQPQVFNRALLDFLEEESHGTR